MLEHDTQNGVLDDAHAREKALDTTRSFIIQAPAGSGKTELLIQRTLRLLTTVTKPEQILAVTFTKKACGEMRERLQKALNSAHLPKPELTHAQKTWQLARAVYAHAQNTNWHMPTLAQRMSILTIDAMCQQLLRLANPQYQIWGTYRLSMQPQQLYRTAYQDCLAKDCLAKNGACYKTYTALLHHHHLDQSYIERLLVQMLMTREQWLNPVMHARGDQAFIHHMEETIAKLCEDALDTLEQALASNLPDLIPALRAQQDYLRSIGIVSNLDPLDLNMDYESLSERTSAWTSIIHWLFTKQKEPRTRFTSQQGILSKKVLQDLDDSTSTLLSSSQQNLLDICQSIRSIPSLQQAFLAVLDAPTIPEDPSHWDALAHLVNLLPYLVARLQIVMQENRLCDFAQITLEVLNALQDDVSEPVLRKQVFDHYQHLMVDECQDISISQHRLFTAILADWVGDPTRTATLVGDPLQSIYRFRQADVGLFMSMQRQGLGSFALENLFLRQNYRSQKNLVTWVNRCFSSLDPSYLANLPIYPAEPTRQGVDDALFFHYCQDLATQNQVLLQILQTIKRQDPYASIGILVRARSQLSSILPALHQQKISYRAVGIRSLAEKSCMYDCITLVLFAVDWRDRTHWVALLRSPFCRLSWQDITVLCQASSTSLWDTLQSPPAELSQHGLITLERIMPILHRHIALFGRMPPGSLGQQTWHALGGAYVLEEDDDYHLIQEFFHAVDNLIADHPNALTQSSLEQLLLETPLIDPSEDEYPIEIMTVHKAKGLEFDYVICPALQYAGAVQKKPLLDWVYVTKYAEPELIMHTPPKLQTSTNRIHSYLRQQDNICNQQEQTRLLYVALTRAKKCLHLLSPVTESSSLASQSWHSHLQHLLQDPSDTLCVKHYAGNQDTSTTESSQQLLTSTCLPSSWRHPLTLDNSRLQQSIYHRYQISSIEQHQDRLWGEVVHRFLQLVIKRGLPDVCNMRHTLFAIAQSFGVVQSIQDPKLTWVFSRLCAMSSDSHAKWIFTNRTEIMVEQTILEKNTLEDSTQATKMLRIDLSFVSDDIRWIIDFKTSGVHHQASSLPKPADQYVTQYQPQLLRYQKLLHSYDPKTPVRTGLYFPLQQVWIPCI